MITSTIETGAPASALEQALAQVAAGAAARDAAGSGTRAAPFPEQAIAVLSGAGVLAANAVPGTVRPPAQQELGLVRAVAKADGSVGRIVDGHLNAVERLAVQAPVALRDREMPAVRAGELRAGVWGGDPVDGEGPPAAVTRARGQDVLRGVKTFCSGAGGLHRALVLARPDAERPGPPVLVWIDLTDRQTIEIDESWYRSRGLVASASHRVVFHDAPVLARFGGLGAITEQPWFGRDALRTAATWAGMADCAVDGALQSLRERPTRGELEGLAAGRILTSQRTIDVWLAAAARAMDSTMELPAVALHARAAIAAACRVLLDEASRACGSRPFVTGGGLDRSRRDLELFLLQHRLDPILTRAGEAALEGLDDPRAQPGQRSVSR
jgi:alkylation response protein AidB-like acyl-CoA dehydrogenase